MAQFLDYTGLGHFKDKNDALYAKQDGSYSDLTAGLAEQLQSTVGIEEQTPYNFRTSGGSTEIGDREELNAVVGGTVAWNQLAKNDTPPTSRADVTITGGNGYFTMNGTANADTSAIGWFGLDPSLIDLTGHVVFESFKLVSGTVSGDVIFKADGNYTNLPLGSESIKKSTSAYARSLLHFTNGTVFTNAQLRIQVFDLTLVLGSTIADYIYALEQSNAGAGVAWFKKLFPKPYYANNSGELLSVQTSAHKMVGFNQYNGVPTIGKYWNNGTLASMGGNTYAATENKVRCIPNAAYCVSFPNAVKTDDRVFVTSFDADGSFLRMAYSDIGTASKYVFTTDSDCHMFAISFYADSSTFADGDFNAFCINIHWDGERDGEYEPYVVHEYALDDITLRGILKLDASNNLYSDGDRYLPDGTVERRYGIVDLGTLTWGKAGSNPEFRAYYTSNPSLSVPYVPDLNVVANIITPRYVAMNGSQTYNGANNGISITSKYISVGDSSYVDADAAAFKAAMSGVYLVYELATPTTETADPYQQTQIVDDFGTEEFVDAAVEAGERDVAIPVGNETVYKPNLRAKLEMAPDSPDGDGDYIVRQTNGTNAYIPLVEVKELPDMPSEDGNYTLRCTVTDGTATLSWVSE